MTQNQINYWKVMEEQRHNYAVEAETQRYNKVVNAQNQLVIEETKRHNIESELIGLKQASAALTSAAAAMSQANTRAKELLETQRVNDINLERQAMLATSQSHEYESVATLNSAKADLTNAEVETEKARTDLVTAQTDTEYARQSNLQSSTVFNYVNSVKSGIQAIDIVADDVVSIIHSVPSLIYGGKH